ncbi:HNH endonuclease, partial [bacterium]|nr:HNH endonuclease [bacterium]
MAGRKAVPRDVRRAIYIEAGYRCSIRRCVTPQVGLDIHHIDGNPSNMNPSNFLLLCKVHHYQASIGQVDRLACQKIKDDLSIEYSLAQL